MKTGIILTLIGGGFLLAGLCTALLANRYETKLMGSAKLGLAVLAPEEGSSDMQNKKHLRTQSDFWFWVGLALTALGVVLQTISALITT